MSTNYVYTLSAARSRLKRGHRFVMVFEPGTGQLLRFTDRNWKAMKCRFERACAKLY